MRVGGGRIGNVGVRGLSVGGGIGVLRRGAGVSCERVVEVEMMVGEEKEGGDVIRVSC